MAKAPPPPPRRSTRSTLAAPAARTVTRKDEQWWIRWRELQDYKARFGHCLVSRDWSENPALGGWVNKQRCLETKGKLNPQRKQALEALNFQWHVRKVQTRINQNGHDDDDDDDDLDQPQQEQQQQQQQHQASSSFPSSRKCDDRWWIRWEELKAYKAQFGDCKVPYHWPNNQSLAHWVCTQRTIKKQGQLNIQRINALNELGFDWCGKEKISTTNKNDVDLLVAPQRGQRQRQQQQDRLSTTTTTIANSAPSPSPRSYNDEQWWKRWEELQAYKARFGNTNVPYRWQENPALGFWCTTQRRIEKRALLLDHRKRALNELGFQWRGKQETGRITNGNDGDDDGDDDGGGEDLEPPPSPPPPPPPRRQRPSPTPTPRGYNDEQWWKRWEELQAYKAHFGNTNVPFRWQENPALGFWCSTQRTAEKQGQLLDHRKKALDKLDFTWHCINSDHQQQSQKHASSLSSERSRRNKKTAETLYKTETDHDNNNSNDEVVEEEYHEDDDEEKDDLHPPVASAAAMATATRAKIVTPVSSTFTASLKRKSRSSSSRNQKKMKISSYMLKTAPRNHDDDEDNDHDDNNDEKKKEEEEEEGGGNKDLCSPVAAATTTSRQVVTATTITTTGTPRGSSDSGSFSSAEKGKLSTAMGAVQPSGSRHTYRHSSRYRDSPPSSSIDIPQSIGTTTRRLPVVLNIVNQESRDERHQQQQRQEQEQQQQRQEAEAQQDQQPRMRQPQEHHEQDQQQEQEQQGSSDLQLTPKECFYMLFGFYARNHHFNVSENDDNRNLRKQMNLVQSGTLELTNEDLLILLNKGLVLKRCVLRDLFERGMNLFLTSIAAETTMVQPNNRAAATATTNSAPPNALHLWEKCVRKQRFGNNILPIERSYLTSAGFQWDDEG